jgi:hypothetical protein
LIESWPPVFSGVLAPRPGSPAPGASPAPPSAPAAELLGEDGTRDPLAEPVAVHGGAAVVHPAQIRASISSARAAERLVKCRVVPDAAL